MRGLTPQPPRPQDIPLSPMALAFHALSTTMNTNSCELLSFDGPLDELRLREAIGVALRRHPLANATLVRKGRWGRLCWRVHPEPLPIDLRVHDTETADEQLIRDELLERVWAEAIPLATARPIRFHLTRTPGRTYFQIVAPHSVTDARSGALVAQDIADAYTALGKGQTPSRSRAVIGPRPQQSLVAKLTPWERLSLLGRALVGIVRDMLMPDRGIPTASHERRGTSLGHHDLGAALLGRTLRASRTMGVTAHALFSLALLRARERVRREAGLAPSTLRVMDLCTIRHLCADDLDGDFDVLVVPYSTRLDPAWSNREALNRISKRVGALKRGAILVDYYRLWLLTLVEPFVSKRWLTGFVCRHVLKTNISTTNPGVVPVPLVSFGETPVADFINFPQALVPAELIMIYTTYRGRLRLLTLHDRGAFPQGTDAWVQCYVEELEQLLEDYGQPRGEDEQVVAA